MLNKIKDTIIITIPTISDPMDKRVKGIEKYRVSLKVENTVMEKKIPIIVIIIPGSPMYANECFNAIISKIEDNTSAE